MLDAKTIKAMFNSDVEPTLPLSLTDIPLRAQAMVGKMSISGVQPKLSLHLNKPRAELVPVAEGGEYIVKPQVQQFPHVPENENCCMDMAMALGIDVPPQCLLPLTDGTLAYVVKRFDRKGKEKIHQENFYQILEKKDKYAGSLEEIGRALNDISAVPGLDGQLFFERVVLNFLMGNGDAHFQNYSMTYHDEGIRLAPAYDLVCTKLVIPGEEDSALTLQGKRNNLTRNDFDAFADTFDIPEKVRYRKFAGQLSRMTQLIEASCLPADFRDKFVEILESRYQRLKVDEPQ
ncbi:MAG: HipA domain-containing protein [Candidatus Omnitrophica bacterium]|nr:HipA domain-containing protein [Candidatus Omnitrophota bacterium]